jgi:hypothetical protein
MTGAKLRELLDAGLVESQVRNMLAAEGVSPEAVETLFQEAQALPSSAAPSPPPPVVKARAKTERPVAKAVAATGNEKLYPMPDVEEKEGQIFLPYVPFGINRGPFLISSAVVLILLVLLIYLVSLTSSSSN